MSRESSVHVMHRARMPPNFMVTSWSSEDHQPRSSTLMVKGLVGGWRLSSTAPVTGQRLRPTPHWRSGSSGRPADAAAAESGVHRLHVRAHHAGSGGRWRSGRHHHLLHLFLVLLGNPLSKLFRTW